MSYTDLRDFCPELIFPIGPFGKDVPTLTLEIEKLGGGTLGKCYDGRWRYQIRVDDVVTEYGQGFEAAAKLNHLEAGREVAAWLTRAWEAEYDGDVNNVTGRLWQWVKEFPED